VTWRWKPGDAISRRLFEVLRLEIRYDHTAHMATCALTLTGETIGHGRAGQPGATACGTSPEPAPAQAVLEDISSR
jgi:hypothetical protein